jgi:hypothetical protein
MSIFSRLRAVRSTLGTGIVLRAAGWGAAAALTLVATSALVDAFTPISLNVRAALLTLSLVAAAFVTAAACWRDRAVVSLDRVALWIEERFPALEYLLITAVERHNELLVPIGAGRGWIALARRRAVRALRAPALAIAGTVIVLLLLPDGAIARIRSPHAGDSIERTPLRSSKRANRLSPLVADVVPPAYTGQRSTTTDEPSDVRALVGSELTLRGRGDPAGVVARIGGDTLAATRDADRWSIRLRVGPRPQAIRLDDGAHQRIVALEPIVDEVPVVTLVAPAHDSVLRTATGRIPLVADVGDDFGIASAAFEYIVSSGEGESFTFKSGTIGAIHPGGRTASARASLPLDSLGLEPGDIVHLRAVARDANDVTGPGVGTSETRTIRIARPDEYDSVAVDAAAPSEADKSVISERMLIMLAEALQKKRPSMARDTLLRESHGIALDQKKLRRTVGDVVFTRLGGQPSGEEQSGEDQPQKARTMQEMLARADSATNRATDPLDFEGDESPVVAVNKPLLEAYNAMWDASLHLELGEPDRALPFMRRALEAIQRARRAERVYLRGAPPRVVIDISKVRLKGKDKGASSARPSLTAADSVVRDRTDRFARIVELSGTNPGAATDSLLVLRIETLGDAPRFAAALGDAASAMRRGDGPGATAALARARRALAGSSVARDTLTRWSIVP